jgi:hypothetical protein
MLLLEFEDHLMDELNIVKYRNVAEDDWYYLYTDVETLNLLVSNFGIISTKRVPTQSICIDNPTTFKQIVMKYCGASIELCCGNNADVYLPILEQNY